MSDSQIQRVCLAFGGVLRDLISLAKTSAEGAYLDDADCVEDQHIDSAIEQLGDSYLLGLGTKQQSVLADVISGGGFAPSDPTNMELLVTRRVLEQPDSKYEVHPALAPLLGVKRNEN